MRLHPTRIVRCVVVVAAAAGMLGCKVTAEDIDYWKGTVKGPGKIVAVMQSEKYPLELRSQAALALVQMERSDVDGIAELQRSIQKLDDATRAQVIAQMTPGLEQLMKGGDVAEDNVAGPPKMQVRAKDAAYLLIRDVSGEAKKRLIDAVVGWYVVDFNGRNLAGNYSAEQIIRSLGAPAAEMLVDALNAQMPQRALVKLAELISQLGSAETKKRAASRLVGIEQHMEGEEFAEWLKAKVRDQTKQVNPQAKVDEKRIEAIAQLNRENFINQGALAAMKTLAREEVVAERLITIASLEGKSKQLTERRKTALQALEGAATRAHLDRLLALALDNANPVAVRDYAFDRVGDIRSPQAIPRMWPLVQGKGSEEAQRVRWRAGEMVLAIGGPGVVKEFFRRLPTDRKAIAYEPEELEGYATRLSQMNPLPTRLVRSQLQSSDWWDRVIALRYFERKGKQSDVAPLRRLEEDTAEVNGKGWRGLQIKTVGQVAKSAIKGLRERLAEGARGAPPAAGSG